MSNKKSLAELMAEAKKNSPLNTKTPQQVANAITNTLRAKDPEWLAKIRKAQASPETKAKRKASMPDQSGENNSFWKHSHSDETKKKISDANSGKPAHNKGISPTKEALKKMRKPRGETGKKAIRDAIRLNRAKPENFTDCPHCGILHVGNQNYKKYHGDACWLKGKSIVAYIDEKVLFTFENQIDLQTQGHNLQEAKSAIKNGKKYKKMFWKLITV